MMEKIAVSACLAGRACRYDGKSVPNDSMVQRMEKEDVLLICPEVLGGLPTPRVPAEIVGGDGYDVLAGKARVMNRDGEDVTVEFIAGAEAALAMLKEEGITKVYLKARSPSCGAGKIYDGTFSGRVVDGTGVAAALLIKSGISVKAL